MMNWKSLFLLPFLFVSNSLPQDQQLGFGCLGLVGAYAGYGIQSYDAEGLNEYVSGFNQLYKDSLSTPFDNFGSSKGVRFGINFFRQNYSGFILTFKGFYQALTEKKEASIKSGQGSIKNSLELKYNHLALGVDLGTTIFEFLDWKVIDAAVLYTTAKLTNSVSYPGQQTKISSLKNESPSIGYSFGSGFIIHIIENYISLEGAAGYSNFTIKKMQYEDGTYMSSLQPPFAPVEKTVQNGGFNAIVQINIGFPL